MQPDEFGVEESVTVVKPGTSLDLHVVCVNVALLQSLLIMSLARFHIAPTEAYYKNNVFVPPVLAKSLRPHQREGVKVNTKESLASLGNHLFS